jgi:hypothetical protein
MGGLVKLEPKEDRDGFAVVWTIPAGPRIRRNLLGSAGALGSIPRGSWGATPAPCTHVALTARSCRSECVARARLGDRHMADRGRTMLVVARPELVNAVALRGAEGRPELRS